jgi:N-[(2S)-2-amino-2-carboxyethyl]-L-glutamate dehydrogenase
MDKLFSNLVNNRKIAYVSGALVEQAGVFEFKKNFDTVETAYKAHFRGNVTMPILNYLKYSGRPSYDRIIVLLGHLGGEIGISGLKEICSSTENSALGLPRASGLIILNDSVTQHPFAIMEASRISAARTATVSAIALHYLCPPKVDKVAFIGCGYQARIHARMWSDMYVNKLTKELHVYDKNIDNMMKFKNEIEASLGIHIKTCCSAEEAIRGADIIMPLTTEENPYIESKWIKSGSLYLAISLLDPHLDVIAASDMIIVDDLNHCMHEGRPLQKMSEMGILDANKIITIGKIASDGQIVKYSKNLQKIFFNPMGTVITDLAVAHRVLIEILKNNQAILLEM